MKNNGLPSKKEWDKITESAFSSDDIHRFSEGYMKRRAELQKGIIMDSNNRKRTKETQRRKIRMSAVVSMAAALALVPASVLAVTHLSGNKAPSANVEESSEETTSEPMEEPSTETETEAITEEVTIAANFYARIESTAEYQN